MGRGARLSASPGPHPAEGCGCPRHPPIPTPPHPPGADGARRSRVRQGADLSGRLGLPRLPTVGIGASASAGASYCDASCGRRAASCGRARQRACRGRNSAGMADYTRNSPADRPERDSGRQRPNLRPTSAPWEGPLVSDTTDIITGSSGMSEEPPAASPRPGEAPDPAGQAGASPEPAGAVRSWPDGDSSAGQARGPGAGTTAASRRGGTGLSAMLLPELQRLAQSMGIMGTGRMRKGQVIAAIEERQGKGAVPGTESAVQAENGGSQGARNDNSVQRGAPAGAGATRLFEQDAMEFETSTPPGLGGGASAGGIGDSSYQGGAGAAGIGGARRRGRRRAGRGGPGRSRSAGRRERCHPPRS